MGKTGDFLRKKLSNAFAHPVINNKLSNSIDDKIIARQRKQAELMQKYDLELNGFVKTYFSKQYTSRDDMAFSFSEINKEWKKLCKEVNARERLININKEAFKNRVLMVVNHKKSEINTKTT